MPLGRYFAFMGSALLALLLLADWYTPQVAAEPDRSGVDKSIIRIHSAHRWPEALAFDTSLPTIVPPAESAAELPAKSPRDAFASLPQAAPVIASAASAEAKPAAAKRQARTAQVSTRRIASYRQQRSAELFVSGW